jgi:catechol 2,3-dioxygenase-like lactoylglutathione lyase family enzyme
MLFVAGEIFYFVRNMNYGFVTVKVKNMEESLKFYIEFLGLSAINKFPAGPGVIENGLS